jgi:hypothetical protein
MDLDRHAPVLEKGDIEVRATPEATWDTLTDFASWPRWMPGVRDVEVGATVGVGTLFKWKAGPGTIKSQITTWEPPTIVAWKGRSFGIKAVHVWRIEPHGEGSRVLTEEMWFGLLPRLLRKPMSRTVRKALDNGLRALKAEAEQRSHR